MINLNDMVIQRIANFLVSRILERTSKGIDMHGRPFEPYGTRPFAMPYGAFLEYLGPAAKLENKEKTAGYKRFLEQGSGHKVFTTKSGNLWVQVAGGYLALKRARFKSGESTVNLQVRGMRGGMLGDLQILNIIKTSEDKREIIIGFRNPEAAKLAMYHQVLGAGKRKVIRQFLGATTSDMEEISQILTAGISIQL